MTLRVDRLHYPVTALGPGRRVGIWLQGCTIGCAGCLSRDTWDRDAVEPSSIAQVLDAVARLCPDGVDGVTISGGEPFEQADGLAALVAGLRRWGAACSREVDILVYSGRPLRVLLEEHPGVLGLLDALIPEPYVAGIPPTGPWHGSGNQPLVLLSALGRQRFDLAEVSGHPRIQVAVTDGTLWMIGIPRPGDLERLDAALAARGVLLEELSWRH